MSHSIDRRFNAFHLDVSVVSERLGWIIDHLDESDPGVSMLKLLHSDLEGLIDRQDLRISELGVVGES